MSLLIKGLKIPAVGVRHCVISFSDTHLRIIDDCGKPIFEGEYIEVPTPHGRLIDADNNILPLDWQGAIVQAALNDAPTIIEAEVSENDRSL